MNENSMSPLFKLQHYCQNVLSKTVSYRKRWKSEGAMSALYGEWLEISNLNCKSAAHLLIPVCSYALLRKNTMLALSFASLLFCISLDNFNSVAALVGIDGMPLGQELNEHDILSIPKGTAHDFADRKHHLKTFSSWVIHCAAGAVTGGWCNVGHICPSP